MSGTNCRRGLYPLETISGSLAYICPYLFRAPGIQRDYDLKCPVNDVIIHPNQGELVSCDQNGSIRVWDLGENSCTHELVRYSTLAITSPRTRELPNL